MNFINNGGAERYIISLAKGLKDKGFKFFVGVSKRTYNSCEKELEMLGVKIVLIPIKNVLDIFSAIKISNFCRQNNIDIIHTHFLRENCVAIVSKIFGNKAFIINTCHMNWHNRRDVQILNRVLTRFNKKIIAVSKSVEDNLIKEGIDKNKIQVVYNGVDYSYWSQDIKSTIGEEFNINEDVFKVVTVARFNEEKGYFYLLDIIEEIKNRINLNKFKFILVGDGELRHEVEDYGASKNILDAIIFTGFRSDIKNILKGAHLYISPSKNEALGISILEAMACGVPVIATNVSGSAEILGEDSQYLIEYGNKKDGANRVLQIYNNYGNIKEYIAKKEKDRIKYIFNIDEMLRKTYS